MHRGRQEHQLEEDSGARGRARKGQVARVLRDPEQVCRETDVRGADHCQVGHVEAGGDGESGERAEPRTPRPCDQPRNRGECDRNNEVVAHEHGHTHGHARRRARSERVTPARECDCEA